MLAVAEGGDHDHHIGAIAFERTLGGLPPSQRPSPVRVLVRLDDGVVETGVEVAGPIASVLESAKGLAESVSIFNGHNIIKYGVNSRRKIIKTAGDIIQPFVDFRIIGRCTIRVQV